MPCDQVQLITVSLQAADSAVLKAALEALGAYGIRTVGETLSAYLDGERLSMRDGKITLATSYGSEREARETANKIQRAYAEQTIRTAAKRYGWKIKQGTNTRASDTNKRLSVVKGGW